MTLIYSQTTQSVVLVNIFENILVTLLCLLLLRAQLCNYAKFSSNTLRKSIKTYNKSCDDYNYC